MSSFTKDLKYLQWCESGASIFSTCAKKQYMSIVLDEDGYIAATGYNGSAPGRPHCVDGACPRLFNNSPSGSDYGDCIALHAEQNALIRAGIRSRRGTLYVNGPPCFTCAKLIVSAGVSRAVVVCDTSYASWPDVKAFLDDCNVTVAEYVRLGASNGKEKQTSSEFHPSSKPGA